LIYCAVLAISAFLIKLRHDHNRRSGSVRPDHYITVVRAYTNYIDVLLADDSGEDVTKGVEPHDIGVLVLEELERVMENDDGSGGNGRRRKRSSMYARTTHTQL